MSLGASLRSLIRAETTVTIVKIVILLIFAAFGAAVVKPGNFQPFIAENKTAVSILVEDDRFAVSSPGETSANVVEKAAHTPTRPNRTRAAPA